MATLKIKKGDTVKVIAGKDKDKEGKVLAVKDGKVLVEGVNMVTKHTKASAANQQDIEQTRHTRHRPTQHCRPNAHAGTVALTHAGQ